MTEAFADPLRPHEEAVALPGAFDAGRWFIGRIRAPWTLRADRPRRGDPQAGPDCGIEIFEPWVPALNGVEGKARLQILYWMHLSRLYGIPVRRDIGPDGRPRLASP